MAETGIHAVTGAFGYSGKYIAARLLDAGQRVMTLTNSVDRENPFGGRVRAELFHFDEPAKLRESLCGVEVLYNTYWVRFNHKSFQHADAVRNTLVMLQAAKEAGVRRVVHISIANPSVDSPLGYYRGKARLEMAVIESGMSYAILRPTVLFGKEDVLVNNMAWVLRHFPVFTIFGDGRYKLQPIYVDDLAGLAVEQGGQVENRIIEAIGPETFTYRGLVEAIGEIIGKRRLMVSVPPSVGYAASWCIGKLLNDVLVTRDEIRGLMGNLLFVDAAPAGRTRLTDWAREHAGTLGLKYACELARRRDRRKGYAS